MTDQGQLDARDFPSFVRERFGGTLKHGSHTPNGAACFHEALNVYQQKPWSDDTTGTLSLITLNDAPWSSDEARTEAMLPLGAIVLTWPSWTKERQRAWATLVAEGVIRRILPPALRAVAERVPEKKAELVAAAMRCGTEGSESAAWSAWSAWSAAGESAWSAWPAAWSAWSAAGESASAAWSAAESAWSAAWSAWSAAGESAWSAWPAAWPAAWSAAKSDAPLEELCRIMLEAEEATR